MLRAIGPLTSGVAAGSAGSATANTTHVHQITGYLDGLYIQYLDSPPAGTTDVTIEATGGVMPTRTLLTITNAATDGYFPVHQLDVSPVAAPATDAYSHYALVNDKLKITIAGANANDYVLVWAVITDAGS